MLVDHERELEDLDSLFEAAGDLDAETARLAVEALLAIGEAARTSAIAAMNGQDINRRRAAIRYLAMQPDESLCQQIPWEQLLGQPLVWVPPGPFLMGSDETFDPHASVDESPQHTVTLSGFWIGRYPVTSVRFKEFAKESGCRPSDARSLRGPDAHPVVNITWYDALAYCRWLAQRSGLPVTLPSEAEWEKAARGTDGRMYPWGNELPDEDRCNFGPGVGGTMPVGHYSPQGDSPYGCADMGGNVWEWTRSVWGTWQQNAMFKYPYNWKDGRENLELDANYDRIVRGGPSNRSERNVRCAVRGHWVPYDFFGGAGGFRIVVVPFFPDL